jgi:hypothetical protein
MAVSEANEDMKQLRKDIVTWECQEIEFKKTATNDHEIAEAVAGFATANVARIYIGVDDDGEIAGISHIKNGSDKDVFLRRISHISRNIVKPPIRVKVTFIESNTRIIVRIDIPKGEEPVYYVDYKAYTRDLSTTRKLEPSEIKNLYMQFFTTTFIQTPDEETEFSVNVIAQLSDVKLMASDYMEHLIKPDIYQLKYDLGSTAQRITLLAANENAKRLGIDKRLRELSGKLEDAQAHEFYMGMDSVLDFGEKLKVIVSIANPLLEQVVKNMPTKVITDFKRTLMENVELLNNEWQKANKYLERGELEKLQDALRRFGYTFHRLGSIPDADSYAIGFDLIEIGERIRKLSSTEKYFLSYMGANPIEKISFEMTSILAKLDSLMQQL